VAKKFPVEIWHFVLILDNLQYPEHSARLSLSPLPITPDSGRRGLQNVLRIFVSVKGSAIESHDMFGSRQGNPRRRPHARLTETLFLLNLFFKKLSLR
jgi:hypothetical protein